MFENIVIGIDVDLFFVWVAVQYGRAINSKLGVTWKHRIYDKTKMITENTHTHIPRIQKHANTHAVIDIGNSIYILMCMRYIHVDIY